MNILFVCHRFPYPPQRGGKIRPFNMIKHLTGCGHQVYVASIARTADEKEAGAGIADHCREFYCAQVKNTVQRVRMAAQLPTSVPSSMGFFYSADLQKRIDTWLAEVDFDLIFGHCSSIAQYIEHVKDVPKILDFGDMDSQKWLIYSRFKPWPLSWGYLVEGWKLRRDEERLASKFDLCTCTTKAELATLESYGTGVATGWFPNGVDHEYFAPDGSDYEPESVSFVGRMDYYPNQECMLDFCKRILPLIREKVPGFKLYIIGAKPAAHIKRLGNLPGVEVTGTVDDVRPWVRRTAAMVAPLNIARGTQNKILEAMAMGVPVVSSRVAAAGIDAVPGEHFLVASTPEEYAEEILSLLTDRERRRQYSEAGRARMLSHHHWPNSLQRLENIIERCVQSREPVRSGQTV